MGDSLKRRRRRGSSNDTDRGEGCSYAQIGNPSGLQDSSTEGYTLSNELECTCTRIQSTYTRRTRPSTLAYLAASTAILISSTTHASASPVHKGKGRAVEEMWPVHDSQDTYSNTHNRASYPLGQSASRSSRLGSLALPALESRQQQQHRPHVGKRDGSTYHSNTPDGVASHYEYVDGRWVPSSDWSLNGQNGSAARAAASADDDGSSSTGRGNSDSDNINSALEAGSRDEETSGNGPSTRQNNVNSSPTATSPSSPSTTLGWAKSTNAILGVDIETQLSDHSSTSTQSMTSGRIVTRSSMATYSTGTPSSTSSASSSSSTKNTASGGGAGTAYDFSRDVPNGWISDGRTAAYAVPVIIGLSVFLACIIFGLILVLLRMNKSRKRRRKAVLNGQLKLSEEGNVKTRPSSPNTGNDDDTGQAAGFSSSIDTRRRSADVSNNEEDNEKSIKRRIGRKWTPNLSNNSLLRKRKKKIAQLFKRDDPIQEVIIEDASLDDEGLGGRESNREIGEGIRRRSLSSSSESSRRAETDETLSRIASNISTLTSTGAVRVNEEQDRTYDRPPSLRVDTSATSPTGNDQASSPLSVSAVTSPAATPLEQQQRLPHARNESIDQGDHHAVPVPSVGPPAYMQPSTPAYSRAPALGGSSSSTTESGLAIPAAGYLSNVSTPGLSDEKRALLGFPNLSVQDGAMGLGSSSNDAFSEQRRYEHLYSSREGHDDQIEQLTGAPTLSLPLSLPFSTTSTSTPPRTRGRNAGEGDSGMQDEELARRVQQDDIEEHRRELQASFIGHVAISDKEVLGRLRMAASAPSIPPSTSEEEANSSTSANANVNGRMRMEFQDASAPSFDETEEDEVNERDTSNSSSTNSSLLPAPPKPFEHALHQLPQVDEKTRLRQAEERQALSHFSSGGMINDGHSSLQPSAPPLSMQSDDIPASAPSAPVFVTEEEYHQYPSAPPANEVDDASPSAPSYVLGDEDDESSASDPESRPYIEGVV